MENRIWMVRFNKVKMAGLERSVSFMREEFVVK